MTISFGLLGAGRIGKTHATAILGIPGTKLAAVFDPIDAAAQHIVEMAGARRASVEEILADKSIDAVLICTPLFVLSSSDKLGRSSNPLGSEPLLYCDTISFA